MPPTALINTLNSLRRRVRLLSVLYGIGIVVAAAAGLLLATVLLDYLLNLPPIPRILAILAALYCLVRVAHRWVLQPAMARLGLSDVAGRLEHAFPDFDDRLRSTVDFVTKPTPGSELMKGRVVDETADLAGKFDLGSAIQTRPVWQSFALGGGAVLILAILAALAGRQYVSPALSRLIYPFGEHPWPKRVEIAMAADLPQRVPVGQSVDVRIRLVRGDKASREARIYYRYGDGRPETEIMTRGADGVYSASLDAWLDAAARNGSMTIWTQAGDDSTPPQTIHIVQRLAITSAQLIVQPPPYVDEPPTPVAIDTTPATVTYGSGLTLKLTFNKELDQSRAVSISAGESAGKLPTVAWETPAGSTLAGRWIARDSTSFQVHAFDQDGFANGDAAEFQVIVHPDEMPSVQITRPARSEECTLQAVVPLRAVAEDDFAIKSLKLVVYRLAQRPQFLKSYDLVVNRQPTSEVGWTRVESAADRRRWQMDYSWDLAKLAAKPQLKPGDVLEYHLEVQDNFAFEGKVHDPVSSGKYRITLVSQEQFTALMNDLLGQVRQELKDILNDQRSLKDETQDLQGQTQSKSQFTQADRHQAQELSARQATAASAAKQSAEKLDSILQRMIENRSQAQDLKDMAAGVRDDLNQAAEHPMKDAAAQIDAARNQLSNSQAQADARNAQLASAQGNQQDAADRLDKMVSRMGDAGGLSQAIQQLHEILNQQQQISQKSNDIGIRNLGKTPDQMSPEDHQAQQANADSQASLADKTSKTLDQMQQAAQQLAKTNPSASQAMQQAAQTGQQQDVASQMHASADAQRQNQQASAQQSQAQAEIGLQMMIHQLEEEQQRQLAALARQLADLQQQVANLLRQQGGLNFDNLALQGGEVMKKADPKVIDHLLELALRSKDHLPPTPDLDTQGRLQEQTERNARGASKSAESLTDGAAIVSALNRAADRMGRAIIDIRDGTGADQQRLASAYDPPQVESLAALQQAKDLIDQQAEKNREALNQQKKDTIRAAYQKILAKQKTIDADTVSIDKAPRSPDGQLGHRDAVLLAQLPPRQDVLAQQTDALDQDLASLDSIVYVWANHDLVQSMKSVHDQLAKPQTNIVTQTQQAGIEQQIQAMIDSLSVKPKEIPFATKSGQGNGGGGQSQKALPTEAELRLLKQLQMAVNHATVTISDAGKGEDAATVALGGRQGQLRSLLDQLIQKASHGQQKLGPEPDPKDKLPEEATGHNIDDQELTQSLLQGDASATPGSQKNDIEQAGQRMGRSQQRLALDRDPGKVTQEIQKRILQNLDALIDMARQQEAETKSPDQQQSAQAANSQSSAQANNNGSSSGQPQQTGGHTPASASVSGRTADSSGTPTTDITQSLKEWGSLSPRQRAAVIEAASEKPVQKFKEYIDEYYQALGNRQGQ